MGGALIAYFGPHPQHAKTLTTMLPSAQLLRFDYFAPLPFTGKALPYDRSTVRADIQSIPLQDAAVDVTVVLHVLEHVPNITRATREIGRTLAPGGVVLHETPCAGRPTSAVASVDCTSPGARESDPVCKQRDHLWSHSCWHLKAQLEAAGLVCRRPKFTPQEAARFIGAGEPSWHHPGRFLCHKRPSSRFEAGAQRYKRSSSRVELAAHL